MKKILIILGTVIGLVGIGGAAYWYWQSQEVVVQPLQQVALDDPSIDSFDDVCTQEPDGQLSCVGNIEQFSCERYHTTDGLFQDLQPYYPTLICESITAIGSTNADQITGGVYAVNVPRGAAGKAPLVKYIIIRDNAFQLIESEAQFNELFQPLESVAEATAYFQALHKAELVLDEATLDKLKNSAHGEYLVPLNDIVLSNISETDDGFLIVAYSLDPLDCKTELYQFTFLLERNGNAIEQSSTLIWQSNLECTT